MGVEPNLWRLQLPKDLQELERFVPIGVDDNRNHNLVIARAVCKQKQNIWINGYILTAVNQIYIFMKVHHEISNDFIFENVYNIGHIIKTKKQFILRKTVLNFFSNFLKSIRRASLRRMICIVYVLILLIIRKQKAREENHFTWAKVAQDSLSHSGIQVTFDATILSLCDEGHTLLMYKFEDALVKDVSCNAEVKAPGQMVAAVVDEKNCLPDG